MEDELDHAGLELDAGAVPARLEELELADAGADEETAAEEDVVPDPVAPPPVAPPDWAPLEDEPECGMEEVRVMVEVPVRVTVLVIVD